MDIASVQKVSLIDFPDRVAAVVFTNGCAFRCGYCYNPDIALAPYRVHVKEEEVLAYLRDRAGLLDGVVVTGGEPTIQKDLGDFIGRVKAMGYLVKIDTCGCFPDKVRALLASGCVDYIAMDVKAPLEKYSAVTGVRVKTSDLLASIRAILESNRAHEFRTTLIEGIHSTDDLVEIAKMIEGARAYYLQRFRPSRTHVDPRFLNAKPPSDDFLKRGREACAPFVKKCEIRN